jgi:hypothetical protein
VGSTAGGSGDAIAETTLGGRGAGSGEGAGLTGSWWAGAASGSASKVEEEPNVQSANPATATSTGNLFVTRLPDGSTCTKVLDFGISKLT